MEPIKIEIYEDSQILKIRSENRDLGSQYDNEAQELVFSRPDKYVGDDLILYFSSPVTTFEPCNIGADDTFTVSSVLTDQTRLWLQVAFSRDSGFLAHSDTLSFNLRPTITAHLPATPPLPAALDRLKEDAFTAVSLEDDTLRFLNMDGEIVSTATVPGSGAGRDYVDTQDAATLAAAKAYTDENGGTASEISPATAVNGITSGKYLAVDSTGHLTGVAGGSGSGLPEGAMPGQSIIADENSAPGWKNLSFTDIMPVGYPVTAWYVNHANYTVEVTGSRSFVYTSGYQLNGARIDIDIADLNAPIYFDFDIAFTPESTNIWFGCSNLTAAPRISYVNSGHNTIVVSKKNLSDIRATGATTATFYLGGTAGGVTGDVSGITVTTGKPFLGTLETTLGMLSAVSGDFIGKTIMLFGDSIIHSAAWQAIFKQLAYPDQINNRAVPSSTLTVKPGQTAPMVKTQIDTVVANPGSYPVPDIIIIAAGVNDDSLDVAESFPTEDLEPYFTSNGRVPVSLDSLDLFYAPAAMRYMQEKLLSIYPDARIIFCSPIQNSGALRKEPEMLMRRDGIEAAARRLSAGFIDLYQNSGIYGVVEAQGLKYTSDGTHLSDAGAYRYAKAMLAGLRAAGI